MLTPTGVTLHYTREGGYDVDAIPDTLEMQRFASASLEYELKLLMAADPNVVAYGCTSATLSNGPEFDRAFAADIETKTGVPAVTAARGIVEALEVLGVSYVGYTSPYTEDLNDAAVHFLEASGFKVVHRVESGTFSSREQGRLTPKFAYELGRRTDHPRAEVLVISCTDFRAVEALLALEEDLRKPIVTSNQALMYACLARLGIDTSGIQAGGRLFTQHPRAFFERASSQN